MLQIRFLLVLGALLAFFPFSACQTQENIIDGPPPLYSGEPINGFNCAAPPSAFKEDPMPPIAETGANYISIIPYGFTRTGEPKVGFNYPRQWWGEKEDGVKEQIRLAKNSGMKVMMKPQIWVLGDDWIGSLDFSSEEDKKAWEEDYLTFILHWATVSQEMGVELLCIGTEIKVFANKRRAFWENMVSEIKKVYKGKITYAANWDNIDNVDLWDLVDYIGVDAYFPLVNREVAEVNQLIRAWAKPKAQIKKLSATFGKPVLFTEWGYLSVKKCTWNHWEIENNLGEYSASEQAQANGFAAFFKTFWNEPWVAGGFLWKWQYYPGYDDGDPTKTFSPQGKLGMEIVKEYFKSN